MCELIPNWKCHNREESIFFPTTTSDLSAIKRLHIGPPSCFPVFRGLEKIRNAARSTFSPPTARAGSEPCRLSQL